MQQVDRRTVLKASGAAAAAIAAPISVRTVEATDSGEPELTTDATIPADTGVTVLVEEYEDDSGTTLDSSDSVEIDDGSNLYELPGLNGGDDHYYQFAIQPETADVSTTPQFTSGVLEIPEGSGGGSGTVSDDEWYQKPDHVSLVYDEAMLQEYQPLLVMTRETSMRHKGMFGYVAKSDEYEYDVCCYWSQLSHQDGLPLVGADSHLGDHEPIYVFVDKETGDVDRIVYTAYHHFAAEKPAAELSLTAQRKADQTHGNFKVVDPWHHYSHADNTEGGFVELYNWFNVRSQWDDNGFYESTSAVAIEDPASMLDRDSWWDQSTNDYRAAKLWRRLGLRGGDEADPLKGTGSSGWLSIFDNIWPF